MRLVEKEAGRRICTYTINVLVLTFTMNGDPTVMGKQEILNNFKIVIFVQTEKKCNKIFKSWKFAFISQAAVVVLETFVLK